MGAAAGQRHAAPCAQEPLDGTRGGASPQFLFVPPPKQFAPQWPMMAPTVPSYGHGPPLHRSPAPPTVAQVQPASPVVQPLGGEAAVRRTASPSRWSASGLSLAGDGSPMRRACPQTGLRLEASMPSLWRIGSPGPERRGGLPEGLAPMRGSVSVSMPLPGCVAPSGVVSSEASALEQRVLAAARAIARSEAQRMCADVRQEFDQRLAGAHGVPRGLPERVEALEQRLGEVSRLAQAVREEGADSLEKRLPELQRLVEKLPQRDRPCPSRAVSELSLLAAEAAASAERRFNRLREEVAAELAELRSEVQTDHSGQFQEPKDTDETPQSSKETSLKHSWQGDAMMHMRGPYRASPGHAGGMWPDAAGAADLARETGGSEVDLAC